MKLKIKHKRKSITYIVKITDEDLKSVKWPKSELEILKRKNGSKLISDIIYGLQVQVRNIEKSEGFTAKVKGIVRHGRTLLRPRRKC